MLAFNNLDTAAAFRKLVSLSRAEPLASSLSGALVSDRSIPAGGGLVYDYAAKAVNGEITAVLAELAAEQQLIDKYRALLRGDTMNTGEKRMVLHHLARAGHGSDPVFGGRNVREFYEGERRKIAAFSDDVHAGRIKGSTGKRFSAVVQIGIGGSDLGPRALYLALERWARRAGKLEMKADFISNVDPDDAFAVLSSLDLEETLFILVSKSGTTQETLANELLVRNALKAGGCDPAGHMAAVTSESSPLARSSDYLASFFIDDFIGGRYSSCSAVGGAVLSLAFGAETFSRLLAGAAEADRAALEPDIMKNAALMDAMIGLYERNVLGYPATAVLPYSQALIRFPAHLQQLDMESNGKSVNRFGKPLSYKTGPLVFGEPGTNGQHSFYQLLHQGTDIIPLQFIGFLDSQLGADVIVEGSSSQAKLKANLAAQIVAFAKGKEDADPNKSFPGGRPSSLILGGRLEPEALGALLAHFENKVMFQGFAWNLNSFDQEGVQLGKALARRVLEGGTMDDALAAYASLLKVR
jgi:glucose-6-phosphate isomerase